MLIRYRRSEDGSPVAKAVVYTQAEHRIDKGRIDPDALRIIERLRESGHEAYIVGGAVRDLLLDRRPKDFDIVTDAQPPKIKRIFRNSRVIGRRFRLVHVYAGPKIFEVSTFRSIANGTVGNEFGTMDEDAQRRDFTFNALYYDPVSAVLVDYVGGFKDIEARRVKPVIPLKSIFVEDPVRMIRCVKYASTTGFRIAFTLRHALKRDAKLLSGASPSRLTEEFVKILGSGVSRTIIPSLSDYSLLKHILPEASRLVERNAMYKTRLLAELDELDLLNQSPVREKKLSTFLGHFLKPYLELQDGLIVDTPEAYQDALREARHFLNPLNLPRVELEAAVLFVFKKLGLSPSQKPRRGGPDGEGEGPKRPRRRRRKSVTGEEGEKSGDATTGNPDSPRPKAPAPHAPSAARKGADARGTDARGADARGADAPRLRPPVEKTQGERRAAEDKGGLPPLEGGDEAAKRRRKRRRKPKSPGASGEPSTRAE